MEILGIYILYFNFIYFYYLNLIILVINLKKKLTF